jgi:hypothetical protein
LPVDRHETHRAEPVRLMILTRCPRTDVRRLHHFNATSCVVGQVSNPAARQPRPNDRIGLDLYRSESIVGE